MKILVACEYSGRVRRAFAAMGHDVISADFDPSEDDSPYHYQGDCFDLINDQAFDLMIAHPPCTYLARSGMRWLKDQPPLKSGKPVGAERRRLLHEALAFFAQLQAVDIPRIAIENPRSFLIPYPATQYIQPWQFGHGETKETGLWLKNLPLLQPTNIVEGRAAKVHRMAPGPNREKDRSRTYEGIAAAMAEQWGGL